MPRSVVGPGRISPCAASSFTLQNGQGAQQPGPLAAGVPTRSGSMPKPYGPRHSPVRCQDATPPPRNDARHRYVDVVSPPERSGEEKPVCRMERWRSTWPGPRSRSPSRSVPEECRIDTLVGPRTRGQQNRPDHRRRRVEDPTVCRGSALRGCSSRRYAKAERWGRRPVRRRLPARASAHTAKRIAAQRRGLPTSLAGREHSV